MGSHARLLRHFGVMFVAAFCLGFIRSRGGWGLFFVATIACLACIALGAWTRDNAAFYESRTRRPGVSNG